MTSQECVDFIAERLKDPAKKSKPSLICEEVSSSAVVNWWLMAAGKLGKFHVNC